MMVVVQKSPALVLFTERYRIAGAANADTCLINSECNIAAAVDYSFTSGMI